MVFQPIKKWQKNTSKRRKRQCKHWEDSDKFELGLPFRTLSQT
jgi:hypothetical protein